MGNSAQWSFHALRTHPGLGGTHLSYRATWVLLDQGPSWRQGSRAQPVNQAQDLSEQSFGDSDLCELECDIAAVAHDPGADLHQLLPQPSHRPGLVWAEGRTSAFDAVDGSHHRHLSAKVRLLYEPLVHRHRRMIHPIELQAIGIIRIFLVFVNVPNESVH